MVALLSDYVLTSDYCAHCRALHKEGLSMNKETTLAIMTAILMTGQFSQEDAIAQAYSIFNQIQDDSLANELDETRKAALNHQGQP